MLTSRCFSTLFVGQSLCSNVSNAAGPNGFAVYGVALPCAVGVVAAILLIVLIIACACYYHKNKVVVIPVSRSLMDTHVSHSGQSSSVAYRQYMCLSLSDIVNVCRECSDCG